MMTGIYAIYIDDEIYIGSSINIEKRIQTHLSQLKSKTHPNKHLQKLFNKDFVWECLEECDELDLLDREIYWHNQYDKTLSQCPILNKLVIDQVLIDKFFNFIDKKNNCWLWLGSIRNDYGRFYYQKQTYQAHRVSYAIHNQCDLNNLDKLIVMHICDNKKCVNPNHLVLGSHSQNHTDRVQKGIGCKLDQEYAQYIRNLGELNLSGQEIADIVLFELGIKITKYTVTEILSNRLYKDKSYIVKQSYQLKGDKCSWSTISKEGIQELRHLYNTTNLSLQKLGEIINNKYGSNFTYKTIHKIVKNQRWKDPNYFPLTNKQRKTLGDI